MVSSKDCEDGGVCRVRAQFSPCLTPSRFSHHSGRGGSINSHAGNERFRELVEKRKRVYLTARFKREKRLIASSIVSEIRGLEPSGRFLSKDVKTGKWKDIGDEKARDKTSQALRENAPKVRAEIETEINKQRAEMKQNEAMEDATIAETTPVPPSPYYHAWGAAPYRPIYAPPPNYPPPGPYQPYDGHYGYGHGHPPPQQHPQHHHPQQHQQRQPAPAPSPHGSNNSHQSHQSMQTDEPNLQQPSPSHPAQQQPSPTVSHQQQQQPHQQQQQPQPSPINTYHGEQQNRPDESMKSTFEGLPSFVSSVPSSIANWTKNSFSFGGHDEGGSRDEHEEMQGSEPIAYVHRPESDNKRPQRVTFREDYHRAHHRTHRNAHLYRSRGPGSSQFRNGYSSHRPRGGGGGRKNSANRVQNQRPAKRQHQQAYQKSYTEDDDEDNQSLLSQVASHIMGSWETPITSCVAASTDDMALANAPHQQDEGQEVELVEMMSFEDPIIEEEDDIREEESQSMQPPQDRRVEIDWPSRIGSCGTWLPEASSFFSSVQDNPLSPTASMDMDQSAAYSCAGSIGGGSLCQVFANDQIYNSAPPQIDNNRAVPHTSSWGQRSLTDLPSWDTTGNATPTNNNMDHRSLSQVPSWEPGTNGTPHMDHRTLNQIPSWERSFRSKSPSQSTICSEMSRDSDIKSLGSGELGSRISPVPIGIGSSPRNSISQNMDLFEGRMRE